MYSIGEVWLPSINNSSLHFHKCLKNSHRCSMLEPRAEKIEFKEKCENSPYSHDKRVRPRKSGEYFKVGSIIHIQESSKAQAIEMGNSSLLTPGKGPGEIKKPLQVRLSIRSNLIHALYLGLVSLVHAHWWTNQASLKGSKSLNTQTWSMLL